MKKLLWNSSVSSWEGLPFHKRIIKAAHHLERSSTHHQPSGNCTLKPHSEMPLTSARWHYCEDDLSGHAGRNMDLEAQRCLEEHELVHHSGETLADLLRLSTVHAVRQQFQACVLPCGGSCHPFNTRSSTVAGNSPNGLQQQNRGTPVNTAQSERQTGTITHKEGPQTHKLLNEVR